MTGGEPGDADLHSGEAPVWQGRQGEGLGGLPCPGQEGQVLRCVSVPTGWGTLQRHADGTWGFEEDTVVVAIPIPWWARAPRRGEW